MGIGRCASSEVKWRGFLPDRRESRLPGGAYLASQDERFTTELPARCAAAQLTPDHLTFAGFHRIVPGWLADNL